ncbi:MAG: Radical SAM superfamily protein [Actinobacteria bacterium ADurb.Bin346]|nr:MAG: Radical SAM superfamily protein [Actinobacteria bacterium ADurb.Bin346]
MVKSCQKKYNISDELIAKLDGLLHECTLCPHECRVNRHTSSKGFCKAGYEAEISSAMAHHGEEPPISGSFGSGTIFFTHCNMKCVYCQNYQISQEGHGRFLSVLELSKKMLSLQQTGCHNINLVSPTIWIPQIIKAVADAAAKGLYIPLVYNTGGYDKSEIIKMLDGIVDIYMPDIRYSSNEMAFKYSGVKNYVENSRAAIKEMHRQVGGLVLDRNGIALKGLLIRLLVLPDNIDGIKDTLDFIKNELSEDIGLSIMAQYHPEYKAYRYPELSRNVTAGEYREVTSYAEKLGFENGWVQDHYSLSVEDMFRPDFKKEKVFKYYEDNK